MKKRVPEHARKEIIFQSHRKAASAVAIDAAAAILARPTVKEKNISIVKHYAALAN